MRKTKSQPEPREPIDDPPELTADDFEHAIRSDRRERIIAGQLQAGDVAALRRFVRLTQEQFAEALGISVRTLQNWEQNRVTPDGPGLALLRIAAREPSVIRQNLASVA
jgi:putative transcriptional regulator